MTTVRKEMAFSILCFLMLDRSDGQFEYKLSSNHPFSSISIGDFATPALIDIDGDKDFDLFIGQYASNEMLFYRNTGTASKPVYTKQTVLNNPLYKYIKNSGCCAPGLVDIDGYGDMDMFSGVWVNIIRFFKKVGNAGNPSFFYVDGDIDMDVFITDARGKIQYYENTCSAKNPNFIRNET